MVNVGGYMGHVKLKVKFKDKFLTSWHLCVCPLMFQWTLMDRLKPSSGVKIGCYHLYLTSHSYNSVFEVIIRLFCAVLCAAVWQYETQKHRNTQQDVTQFSSFQNWMLTQGLKVRNKSQGPYNVRPWLCIFSTSQTKQIVRLLTHINCHTGEQEFLGCLRQLHTFNVTAHEIVSNEKMSVKVGTLIWHLQTWCGYDG